MKNGEWRMANSVKEISTKAPLLRHPPHLPSLLSPPHCHDCLAFRGERLNHTGFVSPMLDPNNEEFIYTSQFQGLRLD